MSEAGTSAANGDYNENGTNGGKPAYEKSGGGAWIYFHNSGDPMYQDLWCIHETKIGGEGFDNWYYLVSSAATPPVGAYNIGWGESPAAVVTAG